MQKYKVKKQYSRANTDCQIGSIAMYLEKISWEATEIKTDCIVCLLILSL